MSNELTTVPDNIQLPAHLQGAVADNTDLQVAEDFLPRIAAKDGHFVLKKDGEEKHLPLGQPIQVVILAASPKGKACAKQFYQHGWSPDSADAPDCSSSNGVVPDAGVPAPQSQSCATCPQNAWGSGKKEDGSPSKGKACSDRKELLVVQGNNVESDIFLLSVPPTSLKPLSTYGRDLQKHNLPIAAVCTTIGFNPESPKILSFAFDSFLNEAEAATAMVRSNSAEVQEHVADTSTAPAVEEPSPSPAEDLGGFGAPAMTSETEQEPGPDLDSAGQPWDPELHASTKTMNQDGTWKKKRGAKQAAPEPTQEEAPPPPASTAPSGSALDDILDGW